MLINNSPVEEKELEVNNFYVIVRNNVKYLIYIEPSDNKNINVYSYSVSFNLTIGKEGNVKYNCPYANDLSFSLVAQEDEKIVLTLQRGAVFVNKKLVQKDKTYINIGDEIAFFGARLILLGKMIVVISSEEVLKVEANSSGLSLTKLENTETLEDLETKDRDLYNDEDYFSKSPRLRRTIEKKDIEISDPPQEEKIGEVPMILTMGPMLTMGVSSVVMLSTSISQLISGAADFSNVGGQFIIGLTMLISTLVWPVLIDFYNRRSTKRTNKRNKEKYNKYLEDKRNELEMEIKIQRDIIKENVISLDACIENLKHRKLNFWDKELIKVIF